MTFEVLLNKKDLKLRINQATGHYCHN